jgi:hypothetical protein
MSAFGGKAGITVDGPECLLLTQSGHAELLRDHAGYKEFGAEHRPEGWNVWLTFAISPAERKESTPVRRMVTK